LRAPVGKKYWLPWLRQIMLNVNEPMKA